MEALCRLCTRQDASLEPIFTSADGQLLSDLIAVICPITIDVNDELPKNICAECKETIISANNLRETSIQSDQQFRLGYFDGESPIEELVYVKEEEDYDMLKTEQNDDVQIIEQTIEEIVIKDDEGEESQEEVETYIISEVEEKKPRSKLSRPRSSTLYNIIKTNGVSRLHDSRSNLQRSLQFMGKKFATIKAMLKEKDLERSPQAPIREKRKPDLNCSELKEYECDKCSDKFRFKSGISIHMLTMHVKKNKKFKCDLCDRTFNFPGNLYVHTNNVHAAILPFPCSCGEKFRTKRTLENHQKRDHNNSIVPAVNEPNLNTHEVPKNCRFCGKDFDGSKRFLETHLLRDHHSQLDRILECDMCNKEFVFVQTLRAHVSLHEKKLRQTKFTWKCQKCGSRYARKGNLENHMKIHQNEPGFTCHICGKTLSSGHSLDFHIRMHQDKKEFGCPQCPAQFVKKEFLERHILTHSKERPFLCQACGKAFKNKDSLNTHIKCCHEKSFVKRYKCNFCDRAFTHLFTLQTHRRVHTKEKPFACHLCGSAYAQKGDMLRHLSRVHVGDAVYPCTVDNCMSAFRLKAELSAHFKVHYQGGDKND